jgi:hypothetical protein
MLEAGNTRAAASLLLLLIAGCGGTVSGPLDAGTLLGAGAACGSGSDCVSSVCKGHCCTAACGSDAECGATACDSAGGCVYPTGACGTATCNGATAKLTTSTCQLGACVQGSPQPCPDHFGCADVATCSTTCSFPFPCAPAWYCSAGVCSPLGAPGTPCPFDAGCASGYCGAGDSTTALCCTAACATGDDAGCGATGCDFRGACIYPGTTTLCQPQSCVGNSYSVGANCDGQGHCPADGGTCAPFACGTNGTCLTACSGNSGCFNGFCGANSKCCGAFTANTIYVDGTSTATRACCGHTPAFACKYLADAVAMAGEAQVSGMTLIVLTKPADQATVQLSYNIVVSAPGVTLPPLLISRFPADMSTGVVIGGDNRKPVYLSGAGVGSTQVTIEDSMTLYLLYATLSGQNAAAVQVNPGGALKLGTDGAFNSGTVNIGQLPDGGGPSWTAISCQGTAAAPASVDDLLSGAAPSVHIEGTSIHLAIGDYCTVNITHNPVFGRALPCTFFTSADDLGLAIDGAASVMISNASFQCFENAAVSMKNSNGLGAPTVSGTNNTIGNSRTGVDCQAGTFAMTNTVITGNLTGVLQEDDFVHHTTGTVDLSGGGNQVYCNRVAGMSSFMGVDVVNATVDAGLNARNVAWDAWDADAGHTELWSCTDYSFNSCVCSGAASCSLYMSIEPDADTVTLNGILVDDTGGSLAPAGPLGSCL